MCRSCGSINQRQFKSEINVHFSGLDKSSVLVFPTLAVCMDCGFTEFRIPETELHRLEEDGAASASAAA
jgi:hypothetical protein